MCVRLLLQYQPDVVSHLEGFDLARELPESYVKEGSSLGPNVWPAEVPGFQEDVYALYEETTKLSTVMFRSFAEMLGLPPDTFLVRVHKVSFDCRRRYRCTHVVAVWGFAATCG